MNSLNLPRFQSASGPFYEVWYFKLNLLDQKAAFWGRLTWLRSTVAEKCETWAIFTQGEKHWAAKNQFPLTEISFGGSSEVRIKDCFWSQNKTSGTIRSKGHGDFFWDLSFQENNYSFEHIPKLFSQLRLNKSTALTPNPDLKMSGRIEVAGKNFEVKNAPGMQGRIFGTQNAERWVWAHCNAWDKGEAFVFEGLSAVVKLGGIIPSPFLSVFFVKWEDQLIEFRSTRTAVFSKTEAGLGYWNFKAESRSSDGTHYEIEGEIKSFLNTVVAVEYDDTQGGHRYCHNSKLSDFVLKIRQNGNPKSEKIFKSTGGCALEWVDKTLDPRVERVL